MNEEIKLTESEAIGAIKSNKPTNGYATLDMAIQALEKQIPKKPVERISAYALAKNHDGDEAHKVYYDCSTCGAKGLERDKPCYHCGQLLDWSDYKSVVWTRRVNDGKIH